MIIGITGYIGSGKTQAAMIFVLEHGFTKYTFGNEVRAVAEEMNLEETRDNLQRLGDEFRKLHGGDAWARRIAKRIELGKNYVVEGMRNVEEVDFFRLTFGSEFVLIGIDAPFELRRKRLMTRSRKGDPRTEAEFAQQDAHDRGSASDFGQQTDKVMKLADQIILNIGSMYELSTELEKLVK